jgi:hypothetical protein
MKKILILLFVGALIFSASGCKKDQDNAPESYITIKGKTYVLDGGYLITQSMEGFYFRDIYLLGGFSNVRIENNFLAMNGGGSGIYFATISLGSEMRTGEWNIGQDSCLFSVFLGRYNPATEISEYSGVSYEDAANGLLEITRNGEIFEFEFNFKAKVLSEGTNQEFENEVIKGKFKGALTLLN